MVDELIAQLNYRRGRLNFINSIPFLIKFQMAFGLVAIGLAIGGIFIFWKIKKLFRNLKLKILYFSGAAIISWLLRIVKSIIWAVMLFRILGLVKNSV